jgi:hypothetical protein
LKNIPPTPNRQAAEAARATREVAETEALAAEAAEAFGEAYTTLVNAELGDFVEGKPPSPETKVALKKCQKAQQKLNRAERKHYEAQVRAAAEDDILAAAAEIETYAANDPSATSASIDAKMNAAVDRIMTAAAAKIGGEFARLNFPPAPGEHPGDRTPIDKSDQRNPVAHAGESVVEL